MNNARVSIGRLRGSLILFATLAVASAAYIKQVESLPADPVTEWPSFPKTNIEALTRDGYLKKSAAKASERGISTQAKNGLLPTYRSPSVEVDKQEQNQDESQEKRNMASVARLRNYAALKRNIQALARDGYRIGRGQYNPSNDKRNIATLAHNGLLHKKDEPSEDEHYFPFYQNPIAPLSEIDHPLDVNEMYDFQQSMNQAMDKRSPSEPDCDYPLDDNEMYDFQQSINQATDKRSPIDPYYDYYSQKGNDNSYYKRTCVGILYPDPMEGDEGIEQNDIDEEKRSVEGDDDEILEIFKREKRHVGSLARLGLLPLFRFSGRYGRSGPARLLLPSHDFYRQHSPDENLGIREYISNPEADTPVNTDEADIPPPPALAHSHPTGRLFHRLLNNDHTSGNIGNMLLPASTSVDNIVIRKDYPNRSLPNRRKNQ